MLVIYTFQKKENFLKNPYGLLIKY